jgi:probable selenium-dependent hydroxylase accessory protein YqeC
MEEPVLVWNMSGTMALSKTTERAAVGPKVGGVSPEVCDQLAQLVDHVIVEADGSRQLPFKAPAPFEPVVPTSVTVLLSVIGADALGRVISDQCHRPLRVAALAHCHPYQRLDPAHAASVLLHPDGPRRACPDGAQYVVVVTKVDDSTRSLAEELAHELHTREPDLRVVLINSGHTAGFTNTVRE